MRRVILALALALAACAPPASTLVFRTPDAPIYSAAAFAPDGILGDWRQVAAFAARPGGCGAGTLRIAPAPGGLSLSGTLCLDGKPQRVDAIAVSTGPGRLAVPGQGDWWVLWVDSGYRTLAVGTPSGRFGFILDRGALPQDRFVAAREIFDFNGYVVGALRPL